MRAHSGCCLNYNHSKEMLHERAFNSMNGPGRAHVWGGPYIPPKYECVCKTKEDKQNK